jgi:hypothetical protein
MYSIYVNSEQARWWLSQATKFLKIGDYAVTNNSEEWAQSRDRIALVEILEFSDDVKEKVQFVCKTGHMVLLFMPELIDTEWCKEFDSPNVFFFVGGCLNFALNYSQINLCPYFFWSTKDFYINNPQVLTQLNNSGKTHYFDVLLGRQKPHRDTVFNNVSHDKNIVTYFPTEQDLDLRNYSNNEFIWPSEVLPKPDHEISFTVQEVLVNTQIVSLSQIIPVDIYNKTHFSFVAETVPANEWSFFTEKIVKPILARRLFIVAAGKHYLKNLRRLGFKTFNKVIDESYDGVNDASTRIKMACEQVEYLSTLDPNEVTHHIQSIVDHNYNVMMDTDWQQKMNTDIASVLIKYRYLKDHSK